MTPFILSAGLDDPDYQPGQLIEQLTADGEYTRWNPDGSVAESASGVAVEVPAAVEAEIAPDVGALAAALRDRTAERIADGEDPVAAMLGALDDLAS